MVCLTSKKADAKLVSEALKALGKDNFALIIHGSSFPSKDGEDTGFGTFNSESGHGLIDYAHGIFNLDLRVKLRVQTLHLIQVQFFLATLCLLTLNN